MQVVLAVEGGARAGTKFDFADEALSAIGGSERASATQAASTQGQEPGWQSGWTDATLPNGLTMRLPPNTFEAELPYAAGIAGADPTAFAAAAASFSRNPALAMAAREQARMKAAVAQRISVLEARVAAQVQHVAAAMFDLRRASRAASLSQRSVYATKVALGQAHRQLAALDLNTRRLADTARLADLKRALHLTEVRQPPPTLVLPRSLCIRTLCCRRRRCCCCSDRCPSGRASSRRRRSAS